ncbi:MAG: hypothetical protein A2X12_12105 [Bacteroidetes bacterium GWE2_29_8]|nr:MAG: hypothetical protein A2X12_12105 [Bacteroidetes bacterium GWE2_29_8]OFY24508.1 MAG: hypothetical protein A2X02_01830 [Bacteroidetes bacterium GWF2_29_10]
MIQIKTFIFNPFSVNTYVVWDDSKEAAIIDCSAYSQSEFKQLNSFLEENKLTPKLLLNTHCHIDHITGISDMKTHYPNIKYIAHKEEVQIIKNAPEYGKMLGFQMNETNLPDEYTEHNKVFNIGNFKLKTIHTPGHTAGGVCFYIEDNASLFSGDTLFERGIGRTDMPTGNFDSIINSIKTQLFCLPLNTKVYPGHGKSSTISDEIKYNPFL